MTPAPAVTRPLFSSTSEIEFSVRGRAPPRRPARSPPATPRASTEGDDRVESPPPIADRGDLGGIPRSHHNGWTRPGVPMRSWSRAPGTSREYQRRDPRGQSSTAPAPSSSLSSSSIRPARRLGDALAHSDAHRREAVTRPLDFHLVHERGEDASTGTPSGWPSATRLRRRRIRSMSRPSSRTHAIDWAASLIQFDQFDVIDGEHGLFQTFRSRTQDRYPSHGARPCNRGARYPPSGSSPLLVSAICRGQEHRSRTIVDAR